MFFGSHGMVVDLSTSVSDFAHILCMISTSAMIYIWALQFQGSLCTTVWKRPFSEAIGLIALSHPCLQIFIGFFCRMLIGSRYIETIDLIYRANTIYIQSIDLVLLIKLLIIPQRLAVITSLQLVWDLFNRCANVGRKDRVWPQYNDLMSTVSKAFPSLTNLFISVQVTTYIENPATPNAGLYECQLLEPVDRLVRRHWPRLQMCQIAPNASLYTVMRCRAEGSGARIERSAIGALRWQRFWRPVITDRDQTSNNAGYWIREGRPDMPM